MVRRVAVQHSPSLWVRVPWYEPCLPRQQRGVTPDYWRAPRIGVVGNGVHSYHRTAGRVS